MEQTLYINDNEPLDVVRTFTHTEEDLRKLLTPVICKEYGIKLDDMSSVTVAIEGGIEGGKGSDSEAVVMVHFTQKVAPAKVKYALRDLSLLKTSPEPYEHISTKG